MIHAVKSGASLGKFAVAAVVAVLAQGAQADTWYLKGDDPSGSSSITGKGSPVGWRNSGGETSKQVVAGEDYVLNEVEGARSTLRTATAESEVTFAGNSLVVNNGAIAPGRDTTSLVINAVDIRGTLAYWSSRNSTEIHGDKWTVREEAKVRLVVNNNNGVFCPPVFYANFEGSGLLSCEGNADASKEQCVYLYGNNTDFMGRLLACSPNAEARFSVIIMAAQAWPGNPETLDNQSVVVTNNVVLRFCTGVNATGTNRGFSFGGVRDIPGAIEVDEAKSITIDGPVTAPNGFVKRGKGTLVLAGDISGLNREKIVVEGGEVLIRPSFDKSAFQELTWIRSDGNRNTSTTQGQWFTLNNEYTPDGNDTVEMKVSFKNVDYNQFLFCSREDGNGNAFSAMLIISGGKARFRFDRCQYQEGVGLSTMTVKPDVVYTIAYDGKSAKATISGDDGSSETVNLKAGTYKPTKPMHIFKSYTSTSAVDNPANCLLYSFKATGGDGTVKFDCVPVRDESCGPNDKKRYGLYDRVHGKFYANDGTRTMANVEVADGENLIPNGSLESWTKISPTAEQTYARVSNAYTKDWTAGIVTRADNTWCTTKTMPDGDFAAVVQNAGVLSNAFTLAERAVYELSFKYLARGGSGSKGACQGHQFRVFVDDAMVLAATSTDASCWTETARTLTLDAGGHTFVVEGVNVDGTDRATVFDDFRLVWVAEDTSSGDAVGMSGYVQDSLALAYDGRENGDGQLLRNLGTAGAAYDLRPESAGADRVAEGFIRTSATWTMPVATGDDVLSATTEGLTLEVVSRMTSERTADPSITGKFRGQVSLSPTLDKDQRVLFFGTRQPGERAAHVTWHHKKGDAWTAADGCCGFDMRQPASVLATRTIRFGTDGSADYFENGVKVEGAAIKAGALTSQAIKRITLGDMSPDGFGQYFVGFIGAVRLYTKTLTDAEIAANAKVDNTRFGIDPSGAALDGYARNAKGKVVAADSLAYAAGNFAMKATVSFPKAPAEALANFPALVRLAEGEPAGFSYATCPREALAFVKDGAFLDFDIDTWDTNGVSSVWVSVPEYKKDAQIKLMVAKDAAKIPGSVPSQVWKKANYVGVWHMSGEEDGRVVDASGHGLTATPTNSTPATAWYEAAPAGSPCVGRVRYQAVAELMCGLFVYDYSWLNVGGIFSVGGVFKRASGAPANTASFFAHKSAYYAGTGWQLNMQNDYFKLFQTGSGATLESNKQINDVRDWRTFEAVYNNSNLMVYNEGVQKTTFTILAAGDNTLPLYIGKKWDGWVDEVRLRSVASTPAWLAAESAMLNDADAVAVGPMGKAGLGLVIVVE